MTTSLTQTLTEVHLEYQLAYDIGVLVVGGSLVIAGNMLARTGRVDLRDFEKVAEHCPTKAP
jgi:uncharacterized membrane protein